MIATVLRRRTAGVLARLGLLSWCTALLRGIRHPATLGWELAVWRDARRFRRRHAFLRAAPRVAPAGRVLILALDDGCLKAKIEGVLGKVLQLRGLEPVVVTYRWCRQAVRYYRGCGVSHFVFFDDDLRALPKETARMIEEEAAARLAEAADVQALKALAYRGVHVGRAALSTVTRTLFRGRVDLADRHVRDTHLRRWIAETMRRVHAAERLLDRVRPAAILLNEKGYVAEAPIFEAALERGLNPLYWCHAHRDDALVLKRYAPMTRHLQAFSLSTESWERLRQAPWTATQEQELADEFRARYEDVSWWLTRRYQAGKQLKPPEAVRRQLAVDPAKPTAVIFSHLTWDASFFHGEDLFEDYEDWLVHTLRGACANPALNWVVKLHPVHVYKSKAERAPAEPSELAAIRRRVGPLPAHIRLLLPDTDLNTFALFPITDYCLTVRGTIGIEMACFGIPVLTAGTGRYAGLGFTVDAVTRADYLATLARLHQLPRLTPEQTLLAKRYAHALFRLRPARFTSFRTVFGERVPPGHPLYWGFDLSVRSLEELSAAPDLQAFADWALNSRAEDFLEAAAEVLQPFAEAEAVQ